MKNKQCLEDLIEKFRTLPKEQVEIMNENVMKLVEQFKNLTKEEQDKVLKAIQEMKLCS